MRRCIFAIDVGAAYVLKRWMDGYKKGSILYREIKEKGYRGTDRQVEGFVNKLKLIKQQGYGRASFPLLRQRVLHSL